MNDKIEFRQIREFDGIISGTLLFIKQNFKPLLKSVFYLCGFFMLAGIISAVFTENEISGLSQNFEDGDYNENVSSWSTLHMLRLVLTLVFMVLNYTALYTSVLSYVALYVEKGNIAPSVDEVWSYFKYYFFRVMWGGIVVSILWVICFVCCFIPGLYVTPALFVFYGVIVLENQDFSTAFSRAFALVKNNWWITFATIFVTLVVTTLFTSITLIPTYVIIFGGYFYEKAEVLQQGFQIFIALSQQLSQIFMIIPLVTTAFVYYSLVERKESVGLTKRISEFGNGSNQVAQTDEEY
ncbi:hypothetical protein [Nubsella zeaxanthinifaciens]|uniref:hypothetical protein n=1 Tax=Nubsella zeaxanthinifaciens TaxID=392412 RepID=UPI000DE3815D|nr:hypothetical protein [Nubsella zeaxanthinifaciens]